MDMIQSRREILKSESTIV